MVETEVEYMEETGDMVSLRKSTDTMAVKAEEESTLASFVDLSMIPEFGYSEFGPHPQWSSALTKWGEAWPFHVYTFASLYIIIALLAAFSMIHYVKDRQRFRQGKLTFTLQCLLLQFTSFRALVMFVNPYLKEGTGIVVLGILWSLSLPGITAAFSVLLLVFLDTTKISLAPPVFQNLPALLTFTGCHFAIVMMTEVLCLFGRTCKPVLLVCQVLFAVYGLVLAVGYGYIAVVFTKRLYVADIAVEDTENRKVTRLIKISSLASLVALSITITHLYAASSEFGVYSDVIYVDAWSWWTLQSFLRLEELASACLILAIAFRKPCYYDRRLFDVIGKTVIRRANRVGVANAVTLLTPALGTFKDLHKTTSCMIVMVPTVTMETGNLPNTIKND